MVPPVFSSTTWKSNSGPKNTSTSCKLNWLHIIELELFLSSSTFTVGSVTSIPKSQPMKSVARKTAIFSRRTTEALQLKVWVGITVALLTLCPQITQGEVSASGRLLTTLQHCVTGGLEHYCSHGCHRNTCFLQLTAPRCHLHKDSSEKRKKRASLTFQCCVGWLLMTLSSVTRDSWWHMALLQMLTQEHSCGQVTACSHSSTYTWSCRGSSRCTLCKPRAERIWTVHVWFTSICFFLGMQLLSLLLSMHMELTPNISLSKWSWHIIMAT